MTYISPEEEENEKYRQFKKDINDVEGFTNKIEELAFTEISNIFPDILTVSEEEYLLTINNGLKIQLSDIYTDDIFSDKTLIKLLDNKMADVRKRYLKHYKIVKDSWDNYQTMIKERKDLTENYLSNYRKHCEKSDDYAYHSCGKRNCSKFLIVKYYRRTNMPKYVLCLDCKKVYITKFISCHCNFCNEDYYSSLLERNEDKNLLLATWKNYHCEQIINDRMKCILCHYNLYLNMQTGMLECINNSCKFTSKQENILWTCSVDKADFKSKAKVYNPLEVEIARKIINQILIIKHRAHPNKLGCNCKLNIFFTEFLHKKDCNGVLYYGEYNNKIIIVCGKCKAVNFYERFIWTCPKCGTRFRDKKGKMTKENPLLKSQNEERLSRRTKTYGTDESDLKDNVRKKNLEAYASPSKRKRISNQKETLNDLIQKRKSVVKEEDNDMNKSSILFRNKTNNFNNNNPLAMSQQIKTPKKRVLGLRDINTEEINNRYDKEEETKPIVKNRFSVRHSINYFTQNNNLFDKESSPRLISKQSREMQLNESEYPKEPISPSSFRRRRKERTNTGKESLIALNEIGENFEENTKKSRLERKREEEEKKKQQEKEEQEKREKERQERREKREKERKEREEKEEKERIQREKEKKEREAQREKERKEKERKEKERQEKREKERKEKEEKERKREKRKKRLFGEDNEDEEDKLSFRKKVSGSLDMKKDRKKYLRYEEESNSNKINHPDNKKSAFGTSNSNNSKEIMKFDDNELEETKSTVNLRPARTFDHNMINKEIKRILSKGKIPQFKIEDYHIVKQLGEGSYGVIYRVVDNNKNPFAMKKLIAHDLKEVESFHKEFEFVSTCKHKNIMKIYGAQISVLDFSTFALYVLMEIAAWDWDSDIKKHLQNRNYYKEEELIIILKQLVSALYFMQAKKNLAHRDIKPQNVLVFNDNGVKHFKVADFGEAKEVKISKQLNTLRGTELYMSPALYDALKENVEDVKHDAFKSDVFSLGFCFIYASSLNFNIIYDVRDVKDMNKIEKILMKHLKNKYTNNYIKVLCLMLETDENKRFDFIQLYEYIKENFGDPEEV
jgi:hypothetical protein